jgi:hypothetical protein
MASPGIASFLDDFLHNLKDKQVELKHDEESYGNSPNEDDLGYLVEKYKTSLDYFISDLQAAVDRLPQNNAAPAAQANANNNGNPSNQSNSSVNNASNNPRGGKRKHKKNRTKKHR